MSLCQTCGLKLPDDGGCVSNFCFTTTPEEREALKTLRPGEWGCWPCSDCGVAIDDVYTPGGCCSWCHPERQLKMLKQLLEEALPHLPEDLAAMLRVTLGERGSALPNFDYTSFELRVAAALGLDPLEDPHEGLANVRAK